jgi:hypothetical protein
MPEKKMDTRCKLLRRMNLRDRCADPKKIFSRFYKHGRITRVIRFSVIRFTDLRQVANRDSKRWSTLVIAGTINKTCPQAIPCPPRA